LALIVDAGALYAQADVDEPNHDVVARLLKEERGVLATTELAVAEADYLILTRLGVDVELAFLHDLVAGTYTVDCLNRDELRAARNLVARYRDLRIDLADASLAVLAQRHGTGRILTFDERGFRQIRPLQGGSFIILPADLTLDIS
jgi:predicted nucleic acid-binding protein